ncbi:hypothetical protein BC828DRAFT_388173 [Blastocladiella britannica]|nr:hypothetical protein BC828DRAFT_388173 [Blastocladiella britannica]
MLQSIRRPAMSSLVPRLSCQLVATTTGRVFPRVPFCRQLSATATQQQQQQPPTFPTGHSPYPLPQPHPRGLVQVYAGPLARTVKLMKVFSISSLGATLAMAPLVYYVDVSDVISDAVKTAMMGTAIGFSAVSTSLINWSLSSYVTRLWAPVAPAALVPSATDAEEQQARDPATDAADYLSVNGPDHPLVVETVSLFGRPMYTVVPVGAMVRRHVIFGTWHATRIMDHNGKEILTVGAGKKLFVHADGMRDGVLGEPARVVESAVVSA